MGKQLPIDNITKGNYIEALEPDIYYTIKSGENSQRHRVVNNLPGLKNSVRLLKKQIN